MGNLYICQKCGLRLTREGWMNDEEWDQYVDENRDLHLCDIGEDE